jgi:hypothetical protein
MSSGKDAMQQGVKMTVLLLFVTTFACLVFASNVHSITSNTPRMPANAQNLGPENTAKSMTVTLWLRQHNKAELDALASSMYQKGSPAYHRFLTKEQYAARFAPTAEEAATVRDYLSSHGLKIASVDTFIDRTVADHLIRDVNRAAFRVASLDLHRRPSVGFDRQAVPTCGRRRQPVLDHHRNGSRGRDVF